MTLKKLLVFGFLLCAVVIATAQAVLDTTAQLPPFPSDVTPVDAIAKVSIWVMIFVPVS